MMRLQSGVHHQTLVIPGVGFNAPLQFPATTVMQHREAVLRTMVAAAVDRDYILFHPTSLPEVDLRQRILLEPNPYQTTRQKARTRQSTRQKVKIQKLLVVEGEEYQSRRALHRRPHLLSLGLNRPRPTPFQPTRKHG